MRAPKAVILFYSLFIEALLFQLSYTKTCKQIVLFLKILDKFVRNFDALRTLAQSLDRELGMVNDGLSFSPI